MEVLTRRLEGVAYLSPAETLADLHNSLRHLQRLNGSLSNTLGKAIAASRLGEKPPERGRIRISYNLSRCTGFADCEVVAFPLDI